MFRSHRIIFLIVALIAIAVGVVSPFAVPETKAAGVCTCYRSDPRNPSAGNEPIYDNRTNQSLEGADSRWSVGQMTQQFCTGEGRQYLVATNPGYNIVCQFSPSMANAPTTQQLEGQQSPQAFSGTRADSDSGGVIDWLSKALIGRLVAIIGIVLGIILAVVSLFFEILLNMIAGSLLALLQFNNFTGLPQVGEVWKLMRDLANMFFIIILLLIAFGTMLRVEKYNWKTMLPKLLIMAVLINFSRTIAGFIIDISQVVMLTFYNSIKPIGNGVGNFQAMFAVGFDQIRFAIDSFWQFIGLGYEGPMLVVAAEIMSFMYLVTGVSMLFTMLAMLAFRIVALWVLVMLSPLAFFLSTFPQGEEYSSRWWKEFTNNVIVGPVLAFFLWLALYVNQTLEYDDKGALKSGGFGEAIGFTQWWAGTSLNQIVQGINNENIGNIGNIFIGHFDLAKFINVLLSFTLLSLGMMVAQETGAAGAKQVGEWAGKINSWGTAAWQKPSMFLGGGMLKWGERRIAGLHESKNPLLRLLSYTMPTVAKKAYERYSTTRDKETYESAAARMAQMLHQRMSISGGFARDEEGNIKDNYKKLVDSVDKLPDWMLSKESKENVKAGMMNEMVVGRHSLDVEVVHEREIAEKLGELEHAGLTAEQKSKEFAKAIGTGNRLFIEAYSRSLIGGNNQDDMGRVLHQMFGSQMLKDLAGRYTERVASKGGSTKTALESNLTKLWKMAAKAEQDEASLSTNTLNADLPEEATPEEKQEHAANQETREGKHYKEALKRLNSDNSTAGRKAKKDEIVQYIGELKAENNPEYAEEIKQLEQVVKDFGKVIDQRAVQLTNAMEMRQEAEEAVEKLSPQGEITPKTFMDHVRNYQGTLRQGTYTPIETMDQRLAGGLNSVRVEVDGQPFQWNSGTFMDVPTFKRVMKKVLDKWWHEGGDQKTGDHPDRIDTYGM